MSSDRSAQLARLAFTAAAWLFVACLALQLFLVGLDLFEATGDDVGIHREWAYLYGWLAPLMVLLAAVGRLPRVQLALTVALLVLFALQTYLPLLAEDAPLLAAFHAVNAVLVFWLAIQLALSSRPGPGSQAPTGGT